MSQSLDPRIYRPHVVRNRDSIVDVLRRVLPRKGLVLEVASGSGEHAAYFAAKLPALDWQPTDPDAQALASISAHCADAGLPNLLAPLRLDVTAAQWPVDRANAVICCNMIHIAPRAACEGLIAGARAFCRPVARSFSTARIRSAANTRRRPIRPSTSGCARKIRHGAFATSTTSRRSPGGRSFALAETVPMPANNLSVIFRRGA